jgi:hypothetical protein
MSDGVVTHRTQEELERGLDTIRQAPRAEGVLEMIVRRPAVGARETLQEGELDLEAGLVGDSWRLRGSSRTADGSPHPGMQVNVMGARAAALIIAPDRQHWPLAGDQLFVDFDLSAAHVPPGTRIAIGSAVIEVSDEPHTGCGKFLARFGVDAQKFVNSPIGRELGLRGINARVVRSGRIRVGDVVRKTTDEP